MDMKFRELVTARPRVPIVWEQPSIRDLINYEDFVVLLPVTTQTTCIQTKSLFKK